MPSKWSRYFNRSNMARLLGRTAGENTVYSTGLVLVDLFQC